MGYLIGVDVGGMSVKIGLVDNNGKIIEKVKFVTDLDAEKTIRTIAEKIKAILNNNDISEKEIKGIGVGVPGTVNPECGEVEFCDNLHWINVPFTDIICKYIDIPITLGNDANAAILGEMKFGCCKNYNNAVMITLGTGVGGGIVINGKLFDGVDGKGAEIGHMTLVKNGIECNCGRKGCFEKYASATALMSITKKEMLKNKNSAMWKRVDGDINKVDGSVPFECSKSGDVSAIKVVDEYVSNLSEGVLSLLNIFRPEAFILGGGVSAAGETLLNKVKAYCEKFDYGYKGAHIPEILIASLGNDAGIIGAAALV